MLEGIRSLQTGSVVEVGGRPVVRGDGGLWGLLGVLHARLVEILGHSDSLA